MPFPSYGRLVVEDPHASQSALTMLDVLNELNDLLSGCEKYIPANDDPSGCYGEWTLDSEAFRSKLQKRIDELENQ